MGSRWWLAEPALWLRCGPPWRCCSARSSTAAWGSSANRSTPRTPATSATLPWATMALIPLPPGGIHVPASVRPWALNCSRRCKARRPMPGRRNERTPQPHASPEQLHRSNDPQERGGMLCDEHPSRLKRKASPESVSEVLCFKTRIHNQLTDLFQPGFPSVLSLKFLYKIVPWSRGFGRRSYANRERAKCRKHPCSPFVLRWTYDLCRGHRSRVRY